MVDEQEAPKNPNDKMGVFKNPLPSHALVSTCWAEEVSDFQQPPTITTIKAINTLWLCEEDPSHWIIMTPTFRLFKRRSGRRIQKRDKAARKNLERKFRRNERRRGNAAQRRNAAGRRGNKTRVSGNVSRGSSMGRGKLRKRERKEED